MLWLYSTQKFNTDIDIQNQIGVILPIKMFYDNWKISQALKNVPQTVQNCINAINIYDSDSIISFCTSITSFANTLYNIYLGGTFGDKFISG